MSSDIPPLMPVSSPPLVREKRHYPGDQKKQSNNQKKSDDLPMDDDQSTEETDNLLHKPANADKKDVNIGHIDEYV